MSASESQPLIGHDSGRVEVRNQDESRWTAARRGAQQFLTSKYGHYMVISMVVVDLTGIFADLVIDQYLCDHECCNRMKKYDSLHETQDALGILSLVISCLFMVELCTSVLAFGIPQVLNVSVQGGPALIATRYFYSWFHWLDAAVIVAGFVIDVGLKGVIEEVGSAIVVLRLWRVFKIVEEFSSGAMEMDAVSERVEKLEKENRELRKRLGYSVDVEN